MKKIGVYDSGMGGLSFLAKLIQEMPTYDYIYYGDALNVPYGEKKKEEICSFARYVAKELIDLECEALVIACNTATSAAEEILKAEFDIPIFGIEPALSSAMEWGDRGKLLVMATNFTLSSPRYLLALERYQDQREILSLPGPALVELVEEGIVEGEKIRSELKKMTQDIEVAQVSGVVLGCTHFLFLQKEIQNFFGPQVKIYDSHGETLDLIQKNLGQGQGSGNYRIISSAGKKTEDKSRWMLEKYLKELP